MPVSSAPAPTSRSSTGEGRRQARRRHAVRAEVSREQVEILPYVKEAVCFGHAREKVCAFINIDPEAIGNWAEKRNLPYSGYADLAAKDEVYDLVRECVEKVNADLAGEPEIANSQIHRFLILHKELDADDGELTRTRKVRRGSIGEKYAELVAALYDGRTSVHVTRKCATRTAAPAATPPISRSATPGPSRRLRRRKRRRPDDRAGDAPACADPKDRRGHPRRRGRVARWWSEGAAGGVLRRARARGARHHRPNGAGKSSMLNVLNGVYHPQRGKIRFKGKEFADMEPHRAAVMGIARTFQNIALFKGMSVLDNIMTGRNLRMHSGILRRRSVSARPSARKSSSACASSTSSTSSSCNPTARRRPGAFLWTAEARRSGPCSRLGTRGAAA